VNPGFLLLRDVLSCVSVLLLRDAYQFALMRVSLRDAFQFCSCVMRFSLRDAFQFCSCVMRFSLR
jgi:hypothetical protein